MAIKKRTVSPRQKMINLMYVVLMAMLALNVDPACKVEGFPMTGHTLAHRSVPKRMILNEHDVRVNNTQAVVIPEATTLIKGENYRTRILMAAVDSTQKPEVFIEGKKVSLDNGYWQVPCLRSGSFTYDGELHLTDASGNSIIHPFTGSYKVIEPTSTVSNRLANMLYAGYENPVDISISGVTAENISASMTNGVLSKIADGHYIATPYKPNSEAVITVTCRNGKNTWTAGQFTFRVRPLPDPTPYLVIGERRFRGGTISPKNLINISKVHAAIDDGILDIPFTVQSFETVFFDNMGNAIPMASDGNNFSERQQQVIHSLSSGRRFYISHIQAIGPDGIKRKLNTSMEVVLRR